MNRVRMKKVKKFFKLVVETITEPIIVILYVIANILEEIHERRAGDIE